MTIKTFFLDTSWAKLDRKSFSLADSTLVLPETANYLIDGEFLELDATGKLIRGTGTGPQYAFHIDRGATDVQIARKTSVLYGGSYTGNTKVFEATPSFKDKLEVVSASYEGQTRSVLQTHAGGAKEVIGWVLMVASANNDFLKFFQALV